MRCPRWTWTRESRCRPTLNGPTFARCPPAGVIGEAMVALVLANAFMEKFGGDSIPETRRNYEGYMKTVGPRRVFQ